MAQLSLLLISRRIRIDRIKALFASCRYGIWQLHTLLSVGVQLTVFVRYRTLALVEYGFVIGRNHVYFKENFHGIQISTRSEDFLVDTLALRSHLHVLNTSFTNPNILKVSKAL